MLIVPKKIDWRSDYSGMDVLKLCNDRQHFLNYSKIFDRKKEEISVEPDAPKKE